MRRSKREEWDYPPRRQQRERRFEVRLDASPVESGWNSPATTVAVSVYWRTVKLIVKMVFGAIIAGALIGCGWLLVVLLRA